MEASYKRKLPAFLIIGDTKLGRVENSELLNWKANILWQFWNLQNDKDSRPMKNLYGAIKASSSYANQKNSLSMDMITLKISL